MLILLPPSESKRDGGNAGTRLDYGLLRFRELTPLRRATVRALRDLGRDTEASIAALKLGPTQHGEITHNRAIARSATLPAADRYTGVLFDALDAQSLPAAARQFLGEHAVIHSAVLGPVGALDPIPSYRLSHDSRLPGIRLKSLWAAPVSATLASEAGLILDARSEAYAHLGPAPALSRSVFLRVVTDAGDETRRALNHFNKHAKGQLVRQLAVAAQVLDTVGDLIAWGRRHGFRFERGHGTGPGDVDELELIV